MSIPFLTPSRCVLLIGDEALYVYNVTFNASRLVDSVPWQADKFEETVVALIRKECGGKPVLILNDMTDQHFKGGQRLPKVGIFDKKSVMERKLQVAFPTYPIRGALSVRPPKGADTPVGEKKTAGLYLFAAVPMSEPIARTLDTVRRSLSPIVGFYLLPVEASDMVRSLAANLAGKGRTPGQWVVFIGQHHNGALRQVITRDGQLAMTRMTPISDTSDHDVWAQEVHQEFRATISYLSRFGFSSDDGVEVIVICHPDAGAALENLIDIPCHYSAFTAPEAARELGITIGAQQDPHYSDPLHAAWAGRKSRFILPMQASELSKVDQPRKIAAAVMALLVLAAGYFAWQLFGQVSTTNTTNEAIDDKQHQLRQITAEYESEVAKMNALGVNVKLLQGAIKTYKQLDAQRLQDLSLTQKIDQALGADLRLDSLEIKDVNAGGAESTPNAASPAVPSDPSAPPVKAKIDAALKLSFPPSIQPEFGVQQVKDLQHRLESSLPNCKIVIAKNVAGLEYSDTYQGEATQAAAKPAGQQPQQYVAEIDITGTM